MTEPVGDRLAAIYARIPVVDCKGLCWTSCGPIGCGGAEQQRIAAAGVQLPSVGEAVAAGGMCPALSPFGRCTVYAVRPVLCRLWGAVEGMPCVYGCRPAAGLLPDAVGRRLLAESLRVDDD